MQNSLKRFRNDLSDVALNAIWTAWSQVGVMGYGKSGAARIVDPEPLLAAHLAMRAAGSASV